MIELHKLVQNLKKNKIIKKSLDELTRDHIYRFLVTFSNRVDALEKVVNEHTEYDGSKVGLVKYGSDKEKWLKDVDQER